MNRLRILDVRRHSLLALSALAVLTPNELSPSTANAQRYEAQDMLLNTLVVAGEAPIMTSVKLICVSASVTLNDGLDEVGSNAMTTPQLTGILHSAMNQALYRRGLPRHHPDDVSDSRVIRAEQCDADNLVIRFVIEEGPSGGPYQIRLISTQGERVSTISIAREGFVRATPGLPILEGDRLPDGRYYWDIVGDLSKIIVAWEGNAIW